MTTLTGVEHSKFWHLTTLCISSKQAKKENNNAVSVSVVPQVTKPITTEAKRCAIDIPGEISSQWLPKLLHRRATVVQIFHKPLCLHIINLYEHVRAVN